MSGALFKGVLLFSLLIGFVTLIVLLITVASDGLGQLSWDFVTSFPSSLPEPRRASSRRSSARST